MTADDERAIADAEIGVRLSAIFQEAEHQALRALQARWAGGVEIACLRQNLADAHEANRAYVATLTAIRELLGADADDDLVVAVRRLCLRLFNATEQGDALMREYRRLEREIERLHTESEERRAERAEAEVERLRGCVALASAYKTATEKLDGVADAEAALFAWLREWEQGHG